jgi:hypothetical protein
MMDGVSSVPAATHDLWNGLSFRLVNRLYHRYITGVEEKHVGRLPACPTIIDDDHLLPREDHFSPVATPSPSVYSVPLW